MLWQAHPHWHSARPCASAAAEMAARPSDMTLILVSVVWEQLTMMGKRMRRVRGTYVCRMLDPIFATGNYLAFRAIFDGLSHVC